MRSHSVRKKIGEVLIAMSLYLTIHNGIGFKVFPTFSPSWPSVPNWQCQSHSTACGLWRCREHCCREWTRRRICSSAVSKTCELCKKLQMFLIHNSNDNPALFLHRKAHLAINVFLGLLERYVHVAVKAGKHLVNELVDCWWLVILIFLYIIIISVFTPL